MFWGLIMEPQRRYTQVVSKSFHISMAALDVSTSNEEPAQVMCGFEGRNYLLCTLQKPNLLQCPLDLDFAEGTEVSFASNGKCHVHLTGYLSNAFPEDMLDEEDADEEENADVFEVENEDDEEETVVTTGTKRTIKVNEPPAKKSKADTPQKVTTTKPQFDEEDESDDSDFDISVMNDEESSEEENSDNQEAESDEDENDVEEEEEEEESSSMSEDEDYEVHPKINGSMKKEKGTPLTKKQQKKLQQQTPQTKSPTEKQKNKEQAKTPNKDQNKTPKKEQKSPGKEKGKVNEQKTPGKEQGKTPKKKTLQGGVVVEDLKEGNGDLVKPGKMVHVYYQGRFRDNNKVFDQVNKGPGFSFRVGKGEVIKGWDVALTGMKVGGKRKIVCPPGMAYGQKGSPPAIPPNSTLIFEVELKKVN